MCSAAGLALGLVGTVGRHVWNPLTYADRDATAMAADRVMFLKRVIGEPATVAGHSSGGLIAAGIAAPGA